jgi:hypothetical protein
MPQEMTKGSPENVGNNMHDRGGSYYDTMCSRPNLGGSLELQFLNNSGTVMTLGTLRDELNAFCFVNGHEPSGDQGKNFTVWK